MKGPPLGPGRKDITWPDQVAPVTGNLEPQNLKTHLAAPCPWGGWSRRHPGPNGAPAVAG